MRPVRTDTKILQVFPAAPGWEIIYATPGADEGIDYGSEPLTGWALVACEPSTTSDNVQLAGMLEESGGLQIGWSENFLGYSYPGCTVDWQRLAEQYIVENP